MFFSTTEDYWMWFCEYVDVKLAFLEEHVLQHDKFFFFWINFFG